MTCADNCSSCSHDRAAVVATALADWSVGVAVAKGVTGLPHGSLPSPAPRSPACPPRGPFRTTNQIQMHIPNNRRAHSRAVDEIMVDCTLHADGSRAPRHRHLFASPSETPCGAVGRTRDGSLVGIPRAEFRRDRPDTLHSLVRRAPGSSVAKGGRRDSGKGRSGATRATSSSACDDM